MSSPNLDVRGRRLRAALGFLQLPPRAPELKLLHQWLDSWTGIGLIAMGLHRQGWDLQLTQVRRRELARDVLRDRRGPLHCRRIGVGAHRVGRGATRGVGGADQGQP